MIHITKKIVDNSKLTLVVFLSLVLGVSGGTMYFKAYHPTNAYAWNLQGSCVGSPNAVTVGQSVTWSATQSSTATSAEHYEYSWSGTDSLTGTTASLSKSYTSAGIKNARVKITIVSNTGHVIESIKRDCSVAVADSSGGSGTGGDNDTDSGGSTTTPPVSTGGGGSTGGGSTGGGTSSGGGGGSNMLIGVCSVNTGPTNVGDVITWAASPSFGNGTFTYTWTGTDNLTGSSSLITRAYDTPGIKNAEVTIVSGSETTKAECQVAINGDAVGTGSGAGGGGGGSTGGSTPASGGASTPNVVLIKGPVQSVPQVLSYVYLSQVPYTGIGDNYKLIIFIVVLMIWSAIVAYAIETKGMARMFEKIRGMVMRQSVVAFQGATQDAYEIKESEDLDLINSHSYEFPNGNAHSGIPSNLPTDEDLPLEKDVDLALKESLSIKAREQKALVSDDAIRMIILGANHVESDAVNTLNRIIADAEKHFAKEDGWMLLNKEKVSTLLQTIQANHQETMHYPNGGSRDRNGGYSSRGESNGHGREREAYISPFMSHTPSPAHHTTPQTNHFTTMQNSMPSKENPDIARFVRMIAEGDSPKIFAYLRNLKQGGHSPEAFAKRVIYELDAVYRGRVEDTGEMIDPLVREIATGWNGEELEKIISILITIIDQSYKSSATGMKLAVMRLADLRKK